MNRQKIEWPYTKYAYEEECNICKKTVRAEHNKDTELWSPESRYWNKEREEVYCSAQHSLDRHQEMKP